METRANHVLIGLFAVVVIIAALAFIVWLSNMQLNRDVKTYDVIFSGSVSGIGVAGDVRFNGLKVGQILAIEISPNDPSKVRARVEIAANTPITTDTIASLESLGVTGVSYINLTGTKAGGTPLAAKPGEDYPVIAARNSRLQDLFTGIPALVANANEAIDSLRAILNEENRENIAHILKNTETFTASLAKADGKLDSIITNADQAMRNLNHLSEDLRALATSATAVTDTAARAAAQLEGIATENRAAISDFARNGLGDISRFAVEARALVRSLERVADHLDSDPQSLIYGPGRTETKIK